MSCGTITDLLPVYVLCMRVHLMQESSIVRVKEGLRTSLIISKLTKSAIKAILYFYSRSKQLHLSLARSLMWAVSVWVGAHRAVSSPLSPRNISDQTSEELQSNAQLRCCPRADSSNYVNIELS